MKKIILIFSLIIITFIAIFVSCTKNETINKINDNKYNNSHLKSGEDFWENGLESGVIYDFFTLIDSTELVYKTSLKMENDTLKIAECKIKITDVPDGCLNEPNVGIIGIPNSDIISKDNSIEYTLKFTMCSIPIGFSDNSTKSNQPCDGAISMLNKDRTMKWFCNCRNIVSNTDGSGTCLVNKTAGNSYTCSDCSCRSNNGDQRCKIAHDPYPETGGGACSLEHGMLLVKATNYLIVTKL